METRSKKRKRQRLMSISSNVSSWPNVPATFESLNDDTLTTTLQFVGNRSYRSFGGLNYHCKEVYLSSGMTKETFIFGYAPLSVITDRIMKLEDYYDCKLGLSKGVLFYNRRDVLAWLLQQRKKYLLKGICNVAAEEGRIDLLVEVWNNMNDEDDRRTIFQDVGYSAARGGELDVLKWHETKGLFTNTYICAESAARHGHLHILQWLQEQKDLPLFGTFYYHAIDGGQLHVMKWLREQRAYWEEFTFFNAAEQGNLDILQWLHDEGCPWYHKDYLRVPDHRLKPEVIEWCSVNGYSDRIK